MTKHTLGCYYAAWLMGNDPEQLLGCFYGQEYAVDSYREVGQLAVRLHGGIGFTWNENVHSTTNGPKPRADVRRCNLHRERIASLVIDRAGETGKSSKRGGR